MEGRRKCTLRTALIVAALLIPGGCLALLVVALLRGATRARGEKVPVPAAPAPDAAA